MIQIANIIPNVFAIHITMLAVLAPDDFRLCGWQPHQCFDLHNFIYLSIYRDGIALINRRLSVN